MPTSSLSPRERIERAAYELFSKHGVRAVGVDTLVARARVAKMTLYKLYGSKDELALAFLRRREEVWTRSWLQAEVERRGQSPRQKLLSIFDAFDDWFNRTDYEACAFLRTLLEHEDPRHPVRRASARHIETIREFLEELARGAGVRDPATFARQWQILMMGSVSAAYAGDRAAARRAKAVGQLLLDAERGVPKQERRA